VLFLCLILCFFQTSEFSRKNGEKKEIKTEFFHFVTVTEINHLPCHFSRKRDDGKKTWIEEKKWSGQISQTLICKSDWCGKILFLFTQKLSVRINVKYRTRVMRNAIKAQAKAQWINDIERWRRDISTFSMNAVQYGPNSNIARYRPYAAFVEHVYHICYKLSRQTENSWKIYFTYYYYIK